ncbi:hypothetical protein SAMN05216266_112136 [Amycolatopsis marina]|uniref:Excreted virulence factor EspC, type VII ESX diderm n=1 Tax=Amycolatopsis marina TaxID=490629 RepID=A0A1I1B6R0_9PSEU|nr:hypothetical protein [Amycolatopsis marina]SFB46029.1 hypothetical protein SAMN05216266_112136 [Amycolatopsis marina]
MTLYDMDPDGVTNGVNRLRAAGESFDSAWQSRRAALTAGLSGVGEDVISQAFRTRYLPVAERLMARADAIPGTYRNICDDAQCCVDDYLAANVQGTNTVRSLTGADTTQDGENPQ